jgi:hypothetical protein
MQGYRSGHLVEPGNRTLSTRLDNIGILPNDLQSFSTVFGIESLASGGSCHKASADAGLQCSIVQTE